MIQPADSWLHVQYILCDMQSSLLYIMLLWFIIQVCILVVHWQTQQEIHVYIVSWYGQSYYTVNLNIFTINVSHLMGSHEVCLSAAIPTMLQLSHYSAACNNDIVLKCMITEPDCAKTKQLPKHSHIPIITSRGPRADATCAIVSSKSFGYIAL